MSSISDQLDAIFDIPQNGSNIKDEPEDSQEAAYAEVAVSNDAVSFDEKASEISKKIESEAPLMENKSATNLEGNINERAITGEKDQFEEILSKSVPNRQPSNSNIQPLVQEPLFDNNTTVAVKKEISNEEDRAVDSDIIESKEEVIYDHKPDDDGWLLTPPSPMYNHFYNEKSAFIFNITKNGKPVDIDKLTTELKSSYVSTAVELTDLIGMAQKITKVQDYLDRVVQIKILATSQCAALKRGVELLRGVLAKVSYEKPAARQDGVIYDHMRDIEMYSSKIESLEQCAKNVYDNLLQAKEILSRKISISIELLKEQHKTDGLEKNYTTLPDNIKNIIASNHPPFEKKPSKLIEEGYDRLEVQEAVVKKQIPRVDKTIKKTGQADWLD